MRERERERGWRGEGETWFQPAQVSPCPDFVAVSSTAVPQHRPVSQIVTGLLVCPDRKAVTWLLPIFPVTLKPSFLKLPTSPSSPTTTRT